MVSKIVKKRVREAAIDLDVERIGDQQYQDLMQNIEFEVQEVLREHDIVESDPK
jgi:hypothetical protein